MQGRHAQSLIGRRFVAADVGGTHARVGLVHAVAADRVDVLRVEQYRCAEHADLGAILQQFAQACGETGIDTMALAIAGLRVDDAVVNANLPWKVSLPVLRAQLGIARIEVVNDFHALAHGVRQVHEADALLLTAPDIAPLPGTTLVVGPGTGLGAAVIVPTARGGVHVLATEAGQAGFAPASALEGDVLRVLQRRASHVATEHVVSGPGLLNLYRALAELRGEPLRWTTPAEISDAALRGDDPLAVATLEAFCAALGSALGNCVLAYGAQAGVWLAGGVLPRIRPFLQRIAWLERMRDKGSMRAMLERVPVRLVEHGRLGIVGAALWLLDREADGA